MKILIIITNIIYTSNFKFMLNKTINPTIAINKSDSIVKSNVETDNDKFKQSLILAFMSPVFNCSILDISCINKFFTICNRKLYSIRFETFIDNTFFI